jgi:hypothetical protein
LVDPAISPAKWDPRIDLEYDVKPGDSALMTIDLPYGTSEFPVLFSFVVEGKFWAHEIGVNPIEVSLK